MAKIRAHQINNKINSKASRDQGCCSKQHPWFSFECMTTNSKYCLSALAPGIEREQTLVGLYKKLAELSSKPWLHWTQQPKNTGLETISYDQLRFSPRSTVTLTKDTTLFVFRFDTHLGCGKGRIIGYKNKPCSVLQIIGFDFDHSAYNHG